jgi:predicted ATPase/DNA-binding SARP family transcriptional activator
MELRILGPLEVIGADGPVELRSAKQRALLAALALDTNEVVTADVIVDRLWAEPPTSAAKLLQVYVSQLRAALGVDGERIVTQSPGYRLVLERDELDSERFERLVEEGRAALNEGNPARARRALRQALRLWRGAALTDFVYADFASLEAERLEDLRLAAREDLLEAELALGRDEEVIAELRTLVEQHPLRERLWRLTMLALYRCGRQAEALDYYAHARRVLRDELGLEPGEELRGLQRAILAHDPELTLERAAGPVRTNVPARLSAVLGREDDVADVSALLQRDDIRLLTLAGAGGSGKTTLALEVARTVVDEFANGVFLVELAPIRDVNAVPAAIGEAVQVAVPPGTDLCAALVDFLRSQELLLVIDNAEHLRDVGALVVDLLEAAPRVKVLVTSRVVLHLSSERVYPVDPLASQPAAELFVARATATAPSFAPPDVDAPIVADICRRLDNLPLAIELAAPHVRALTLEQLHERLSRRLPLLTGGARDLPARQQTLRDTIEWSYALLDRSAQSLLADLSVFEGGFTLAAAEDVASRLDTPVVEQLHALLDANLVRRRFEHEPPRFELLETIREFALERLDASGDGETTRWRHAEFFLELAESAGLSVEAVDAGTPTPERYDVRPELANLRAALDWAVESDPELGLRIATALEQFWVTHGPTEGVRRFEALLVRASDAPALLRARALRAQGGSLYFIGDSTRAQRANKEALELFEASGDELGAATMIFRTGTTYVAQRDFGRARPLLEDSLRRFRNLGSRRGECEALGNLGSLALHAGRTNEGHDLTMRSIEIARELGWGWWEAGQLMELARHALDAGEVERAESWAREALTVARPIGGERILRCLALLTLAFAQRGDAERAGLLRGAIDKEAGGTRFPSQRVPTASGDDVGERYVGSLDGVAGPEFERAREVGCTLSLDEVIDRAYGESDLRVS